MNKDKKEKLQRYLIEALKATHGCTSATCPMTDNEIGTANMCKCEWVVDTMIGAAHKIMQEQP